jgi:DNA-binding beta-propeller fold protein YncE
MLCSHLLSVQNFQIRYCVCMLQGIQNPYGLAIDWISQNIYVSSFSSRGASITVSKLDGAYRLMLDISPQHLRKPNSLAVHPVKAYVVVFLNYLPWFHAVLPIIAISHATVDL